MWFHKGEVLFRQGELGSLFQIKSGLFKIVRIHDDGSQILLNIVVSGETIPHHSLVSPNTYHGTAVALMTSEVEIVPAQEWYKMLQNDPVYYKQIALLLQEKLIMLQQRIDQLSQVTPMKKLIKLQTWFDQYISPSALTDVLTQDEIGQLIGLRRETINRLLRIQAASPQITDL